MTDEKKSKRPPARWRKAKWPDASGRWATPMNRFVWENSHGKDIELWRGATRLAVAAPAGSGVWKWRLDIGPDRHTWMLAAGKAEAMSRAREDAVEAEALVAAPGAATKP